MIDRNRSKNPFASSSDPELLDFINGGKESALTELYDRYWESIFLYVVKVLKDPDGASDVVQETFIALWQKRGELDAVRSLKAYLISIARYKALKSISLNLSEERYRTSLLSFFNEVANDPETQLMAQEMDTFLESQIQALPDRMREVFLLSRREQLSHAEIADRLQISDKTVKKQIYYALRQLRSAMDEQHMWTTIFLCSVLC
ncbi:RNA polymerase sigma-70 factor (ECF subfamily) [Larkinella arboricola]|uniref:RNA polymerase sigma-70 factor (ECF subfamily) n=1 Tax=Larkinella arboricola TaxID=643671 RepID=A0A327WRA2_LARAB|nr:RNA polymerase sigma-70 factor [Larkinella arboricola]RAJ93206.1 RNA polymerase sigma-70 factor (ECF subfamily) [Larkinella arboricola]